MRPVFLAGLTLAATCLAARAADLPRASVRRRFASRLRPPSISAGAVFISGSMLGAELPILRVSSALPAIRPLLR
jgi:hypothetical protein